MIPRRCISVVLGVLLLMVSLGTVRALDQPAEPGGAPDPKPAPFQPPGFVRVVDGDSFEVSIDGRRVAVAVLGIDAPSANTPCGEAARAQLQALIGRGVVLADDPSSVLDGQKRRVYRVSTTDGRAVAPLMVGAGLARATGLGPEAATLAALEAKARQERAGCVWGGPLPAPRTTATAGADTRLRPTAAASVPSGFADDVVVSGLAFPTAFAFLPDGRVLVAEKAGLVKLVANNAVQSPPVLDIRSRVNAYWDRGVLGLAVDPSFATNRSFYVYYTYESNAAQFEGPKSGQLVRFVLRPDNTADPNAGVVILGSQPGSGCPSPPSTADCIPADGASHAGGALRFGADGSLFVSTGDGASFSAVDPLALRAQDLNSLAGKILRVTTAGQGLSSNPFWTGDPSHPRSKIWASGFRNPFRMTVRPGGGALFVGDVGWVSWEEIDVVPAGANAGWPCYEGGHVQDGYRNYPICQSLYGQSPSPVRMPLIEWAHGDGGAALAGTFYAGSAFPASYQGAFFYADYARGWVGSVRLDSNNQLTSPVEQFAGAIVGPVQLETGPDGALWYAAIGSGELRRIRYVGSYTPLQCPAGQWRAEYYQNQTLFGAPVVQRCETAIDYDWGFGSPAPGIGIESFSVRWTGRFTFGDDTYDFSTRSDDGARLFVDGEMIINDWVGGAANTVTASKAMTAGEHTIVAEYYEDCCPAEMRVSWAPRNPNTPPVPTIQSPAAGTRFKVGDVIQLQGSATDPEQGQLPGTSLRWDVILKHCPGFGASCHDHPLLTLTGSAGQFTAPDHGDGTSFEVRLTATDAGGLTGVATRQVDPKTVQVTLATSPAGGTVVYDGTSHTPPYTTTTIAGSAHTIAAQPPPGQPFIGWAHGGPQQQNVTVGEQDVTYTATFETACTPRPRVVLATALLGGDRLQVSLAASTNPGQQANLLRSIEFQEIRHAEVELPGRPRTSAPFTAALQGGVSQTGFVVHRIEPDAVMVRFVVHDDCGAWPTFVGAGSRAGW